MPFNNTKGDLTMEAKLSIENNEFIGVRVMGCLHFPDTVTRIGNYAFKDQSITSVIIPDSVTSIGEGAFAQCYSLKSIVIPDSVVDIGADAFCDCISLERIAIPASVTGIADSTF